MAVSSPEISTQASSHAKRFQPGTGLESSSSSSMTTLHAFDDVPGFGRDWAAAIPGINAQAPHSTAAQRRRVRNAAIADTIPVPRIALGGRLRVTSSGVFRHSGNTGKLSRLMGLRYFAFGGHELHGFA